MSQRYVYRVFEDSLQEKFDALRTKVQIYAGGFANGKTAASVVLKALVWARDYPGSNGLIARSTYPKLNDTIRKEFLKWCPGHWIKSFPRSANGSNTCTLTNGTTINFRYVAQQSAISEGQGTSNLLSATYDWIIVDQIEDPEIVEKDFDDLLGRLRGMAQYQGSDPTMPRSGPRYIVLTCNPTRNWVYRKLIKPLQLYNETGMITDDLMCERHENERPVLDDSGHPNLMINLVEGSTYANRENLEKDFIQTLEARYRGAMRTRFLHGGWGSYEGLVYPQYDPAIHMLPHNDVMEYLGDLQQRFYELNIVEGYDFGIAVPSCYIFTVWDAWGNGFCIDGFYEKGEDLMLEDQRDVIKAIRDKHGVISNLPIMSDPSIFRRTSASKRTVGSSTADILYDRGNGIRMVRGNSDIHNGIVKVASYLTPMKHHPHPLTGEHGAPHLYLTDNMPWLDTEFTTYMWKTNSKGEKEDMPKDKDDHGMDTIRYILSRRPDLAKIPTFAVRKKPDYLTWREHDTPQANPREHRYAGH